MYPRIEVPTFFLPHHGSRSPGCGSHILLSLYSHSYLARPQCFPYVFLGGVIALVNRGLLTPIQYQQESPVWGVVKGDFIQWKQLNHETAWLWHNCEVALGVTWPRPQCCSLVLWWDSFAPVQQGSFSVTALAGGTVFGGNRNCFSSRRAAELHIEKFTPWISDWAISMQIGALSPHSLIEPNSIILIGQNGATLISQWSCKGGYSYTVSIVRRKFQSYWLKNDSSNSFVSIGSDGRDKYR